MKDFFKNSKFKYGVNATAISVGVIIGIILLNLIITSIVAKYPLKLDFSKDQVFEFSQQTKDILKSLSKPINVYAMYPDNLENENVKQVKEFLNKYQAMSEQFKVQYIDPVKDPTFLRKYEAKGETVGEGSIILDDGSKAKVIGFNEMFSQNQNTGETSILAEQKLTAAIAFMQGEAGKNIIYFVQGHGENENTGLSQTLSQENYEVKNVNLTSSAIQSDALAVVCIAPARDFLADEITKLDGYLSKGGKIFFALAPGQSAMPRLESYLQEWGIIVQNDLVIEGDANKVYRTYNQIIVAPDMQPHDITNKLLAQNLSFFVPNGRSFEISQSAAQGAKVTSLLKTTNNSWGKVNFPVKSITQEATDIKGPLNIAVVSEKLYDNFSAARIFALGSIEALGSELLSEASYANGDFILNTFSWMTERKDQLSIRPKVISPEKLVITQQQSAIAFYVLLAFPIFILAAGLIVWYRRRYL